MMRGLAGLVLTAGLLPALHAQEIWRHVDEQGAVRYADRPFAGAVRLELSEGSGWRGPAPVKPRHVERRPGSNGPQDGAERALAILSPAAEETVWGTGGTLEVRLSTGSERQPGSRLVLELDGAEAAWRGEPPTVRLGGVWRGEHRIRALLLDDQGKELASSGKIRFYKREPVAAGAASHSADRR